MIPNVVETNTVPSEKDSPESKHNEHYHVNKFNQLANDDRTVQHTEDFSDYVNEEHTDYVDQEYDEDYFVNDEEETEDPNANKPPEHLNRIRTDNKGVTQVEQKDRINDNNSTDLKWFNKQPAIQSNEKQIPQQNNFLTKPTSNLPVINAPSSNGSFPNEAEIKNSSNIQSRIKNIKENANRLKNEKIIYADEKLLLLKFKLTPLNESSFQTVQNDDAQENDNFEKKLRGGKPKDLSGLFDSSIFDDDDSFFDDSFFDDFEDSKGTYFGKPNSDYERTSQRRTGGKGIQQYKEKYSPGKSNSQSNNNYYKTGKGVWIGNKYYPYHGPGFGRPRHPSYHFDHDFSDEDSSDSDYSSDCSDEYEDSDEDGGEDPGILYGTPEPGVNPVPGTTGGDPGILIHHRPGTGVHNTPPVTSGTPGGVPGILIHHRPGTSIHNTPPVTSGMPGGDTGILYGNSRPGIDTPGVSNIGTGTGTLGNNTDVVLVVIATQ